MNFQAFYIAEHSDELANTVDFFRVTNAKSFASGIAFAGHFTIWRARASVLENSRTIFFVAISLK